jgi:CO/xanthine dehydrogenase FAD-binding subunit
MKAAPFEYERVTSVAEACALLATHGADAKLIAGGQSLVPMMAMRLARPTLLVDLNPVEEIQQIHETPEYLSVGAGIRQSHIERDPLVLSRVPLLARGLQFVGHLQTRNRGTPGGSLVHADPSAEIPLVACALDAELKLVSLDEEMLVSTREFFLAPMVTAITPEQCLVEIRFPVWRGERVGCSFQEVSIRHGDFALVSACAQVAVDENGQCTRAALGVGGAAAVPLALPDFAQPLVGTALEEKVIADTARAAAVSLEPEADLHASAEYRRHLAEVLLAAALRAARDEALKAVTCDL